MEGSAPRLPSLAFKTGRLRPDQLPALLSERTRPVAVGGASEALGILNDLPAIVAAVRSGCDVLVSVDAIPSAPYVPLDVEAIGCGLLARSLYKLFGLRLGMLWWRSGLADATYAYKVPPALVDGARRLEMGTRLSRRRRLHRNRRRSGLARQNGIACRCVVPRADRRRVGGRYGERGRWSSGCSPGPYAWTALGCSVRRRWRGACRLSASLSRVMRRQRWRAVSPSAASSPGPATSTR